MCVCSDLFSFIKYTSFHAVFLFVKQQDGKMMFTLEANNLVDENGNSKQTQMPYFENGWVEEKDESDIATKNGSGFKFPWQQ